MRHLVIASAALLLLSACVDAPADPNAPQPSPPANHAIHESGIDSPLGFGFTVPEGAVQVGPLVRFRSDKLIQAYEPDLTQALLLQASESAERALSRALAGNYGSDEESPEPYVEPLSDTFSLLDDPPRPDVMYAHMRIDGDETAVFQAMLTQIRRILPATDIHPNQWSEYCKVKNDLIEQCSLKTTGVASNGHQISVQLRIFIGDVETRTAALGSKQQPVMTLNVAYLGDPRVEQVETGSFELVDLPPGPAIQSTSYTWPQMDADADRSTPILDREFVVGDDVEVLLSGGYPNFVILLGSDAAALENLGRNWVKNYSDAGDVRRDVVENLNEFSTTFIAETKQPGLNARASLVQSARGNYLVMTFSPAK